MSVNEWSNKCANRTRKQRRYTCFCMRVRPKCYVSSIGR